MRGNTSKKVDNPPHDDEDNPSAAAPRIPMRLPACEESSSCYYVDPTLSLC